MQVELTAAMRRVLQVRTLPSIQVHALTDPYISRRRYTPVIYAYTVELGSVTSSYIGVTEYHGTIYS